jgi:hypothetical protein
MTKQCTVEACTRKTDGMHRLCYHHRMSAAPAEVPKDIRTPEQRTKEQLQVARAQSEVKRLQEENRELQKLAVSGDSVRQLLGTLGAPNHVPDPDWMRGPRSKKSVTGTAVLFISDIHGDEVVSRAQVGGANEYNREIMQRSVRNTFKSAVVLLKDFMASPKYEGIVCPLGGDIVSGNIHEELVETNEAPIMQTMLVMEELLIEGLGILADEFGKVHVPCVTGNHGRMHKKPRAKNRAFESFEWMIYQRVASYFRKDSRLTFDIPEGPDAYFQVYNKRICLSHGDQFRGGDGVGGILVPIKRGLSRKQFRDTAMGQAFDMLIIGHWHQLIQLSDLVVNGSIKGIDEWSYSMNFGFEQPQQALFVVHPEVGVSARWPVLCRYEGGKLKAKENVR